MGLFLSNPECGPLQSWTFLPNLPIPDNLGWENSGAEAILCSAFVHRLAQHGFKPKQACPIIETVMSPSCWD